MLRGGRRTYTPAGLLTAPIRLQAALAGPLARCSMYQCTRHARISLKFIFRNFAEATRLQPVCCGSLIFCLPAVES